MRYTEYHAGKAVIKDKGLLSEAMEKLARLEDAEDTNVLSRWIPIVRDCQKKRNISCCHSQTILVWILDGMKMTERTIKFYPGDEEETYASYGLIVNAWMPLPEPYREEE